MKDTPLVEQYCKIAGALRPMIERVGDHEKRISTILPHYQKFLDKLSEEGQFAVLDELKYSHKRAEQADLHLNYYGTKADARRFETIEFPSVHPHELGDVVNMSPLEKFASISSILRGVEYDSLGKVRNINNQTYFKKIGAILPEYQKFINELRERRSKLFNEFWFPQVAGLDSTYGVAWPEFMSLMSVGPHNTYVNSRGQTLKQSVNWVLSGGSEQGGIVELLEPAKFYRHWEDINFTEHISFEEGKEDKPKTTYSSVEDVLTDPKEYDDCAHFVAMKTRLNGLPINEGKSFETPLALNNWFGDNSMIHITQTPYNPSWDM